MKTTITQNIFRVLLGVGLVYAGISHLTFNRTEFQAQVPEWLPIKPDLVVVLSGVAEIALGSCLVFLVRKKRSMGIITALFFVLVFPGNIAQYIHKKDAFGLDTDKLRFARLFFQPVLIVWALWSAGIFNKKQISH